MERVESGGVVGMAIVALFLVGMVIAIVRGGVVFFDSATNRPAAQIS
ncbi:hypothetical protein QW180_18615 [Vibrio sinaloensis]|nr:hypothetical protein [Vibrio sinaloensis]